VKGQRVQVYVRVEELVVLLVVTLAVALVARRLRLPYTLVLVVVGLLIGFAHILPTVRLEPDVVLVIFLPALLFEGAWSAEVAALRASWLPVFLLAVPGLLLSLLIVAVVLHWGLGLGWLVALLAGAIVSPTDPVAVLALLRQMGLPARLRTLIEGESLFNDGVGTAAYVVVLGLLLAANGMASAVSPGAITLRALWLFAGGPLLGALIGFLTARLLYRIDDRLIEITTTFCVAYGSYLIGEELHTSGLLTVVVTGLIIGSYGRRIGLTEAARAAADDVWEFIGYVANSLLFLLLGVQIGAASFAQAIPGIIWAVAGVIVGRAAMIYLLLPLYSWFARRRLARQHHRVKTLSPPQVIPPAWRPVLLLAGLRGALSLALVLSLPDNLPQRPLLDGIIYGVVLVTLLGQGLGLRVLLARWKME
jgi:CPA1 family monovalent cation:H+ antiporter